MKNALSGLLAILLVGCGAVGSQNRPDNYYSNTQTPAGLEIDSLLGDNDEKISELLRYQVVLPPQNRIAILKLSKENNWRFYSDDFNTITESVVKGFIETLRSSSKVYDASYLPAMLVPAKRTLPSIREAAARFQADLLLAYRTSCSSYNKYKFLDPNETKAYCSVEAMLMDVRSGVITKSVVSTQNFVATKNDSDINFSETIKKAELESQAKALSYIAEEINEYLKTVKVLSNTNNL